MVLAVLFDRMVFSVGCRDHHSINHQVPAQPKEVQGHYVSRTSVVARPEALLLQDNMELLGTPAINRIVTMTDTSPACIYVGTQS